MKQVLSIAGQTVLLFAAAFAGFLLGMFVPALRLSHEVSRTATSIRTYDLDWLLAVLLVYALILLIAFFRQTVRTTWIGTTVALVLTIAIVMLFTQIGVKDTPIALLLGF
jgi:NAD/NADP transhydrogenase beta subunit